jgi:hypothetical protein
MCRFQGLQLRVQRFGLSLRLLELLEHLSMFIFFELLQLQ